MWNEENISQYADSYRDISKNYLENEHMLVNSLIEELSLSEDDRIAIMDVGHRIVSSLRSEGETLSIVDKLLQEYGLSSDEGILLMRLSEALVRTADSKTARALIRDN